MKDTFRSTHQEKIQSISNIRCVLSLYLQNKNEFVQLTALSEVHNIQYLNNLEKNYTEALPYI